MTAKNFKFTEAMKVSFTKPFINLSKHLRNSWIELLVSIGIGGLIYFIIKQLYNDVLTYYISRQQFIAGMLSQPVSSGYIIRDIIFLLLTGTLYYFVNFLIISKMVNYNLKGNVTKRIYSISAPEAKFAGFAMLYSLFLIFITIPIIFLVLKATSIMDENIANLVFALFFIIFSLGVIYIYMLIMFKLIGIIDRKKLSFSKITDKINGSKAKIYFTYILIALIAALFGYLMINLPIDHLFNLEIAESITKDMPDPEKMSIYMRLIDEIFAVFKFVLLVSPIVGFITNLVITTYFSYGYKKVIE